MYMVILTFRKCYFSPFCYLLFFIKSLQSMQMVIFTFRKCYFSPLLLCYTFFFLYKMSSEYADGDFYFSKVLFFSIATLLYLLFSL
jgi:hypothetical protein